MIIYTAVLAAAGAPVSSSFAAGTAVPAAPAVEAKLLPAQQPAQATAKGLAVPSDRAVVDKIVRLQGRELTLCLVRSGSAGMAVLSVPENSSVPALPEIPDAEFLDLVTKVSGCDPDGEVREVASHRGTIAISADLDCSAAGS
ncbi:hypothetical protein [Leisingera sp. ANG-M1]|uniref:hypothetical protein n=1 Tax=Leisingera sp. ANG-M1 TaxID=1577895 RepID=UPI0019D3E563|nr:hypothetical protein [Leisingera sp. ANG-M1]